MSLTEKYFKELVYDILGEEKGKELLRDARLTYGKEWWYEWLGIGKTSIIKNIKDVSKMLGL